MKSKKCVPLILLIIDIALAAVIAVSYFNAGPVTGGIAADNNNTVTQNENVPTSADEKQTEALTEKQTETVTEKPTEKPAEKPTEKQTEKPAAAKDLSTKKRPTGTDFADWFTGSVMYRGVPAGVTKITELSQIKGGWKGFIYYDPENKEGSQAMELLNFYIDEGTEGLTLTADWYSIYWVADGQGESEEDMDDMTFPSTFENGCFKADRDTVITFTDFYELDGKQYACGTIETPRGINGKVAMVRP